MSFWGKLANIAGSVGAAFIPGGSLLKDGIKAGISAGGAALGSIADAQAQNRGTLGEMEPAQEQIDLLRRQDARAGKNDAWKAVQQAEYLANGGNA